MISEKQNTNVGWAKPCVPIAMIQGDGHGKNLCQDLGDFRGRKYHILRLWVCSLLEITLAPVAVSNSHHEISDGASLPAANLHPTFRISNWHIQSYNEAIWIVAIAYAISNLYCDPLHATHAP